jgi:hypothetical protein
MKYIILFLSVIVVFASCTQQTIDVPESQQDKMIASQWQLDSITVTVRDTFGIDSTYTWALLDCKKDDKLEFKANFKAIHHTGDTKCYYNEAGEYDFTWQLSDNGKTLGMYNLDDFFLGSQAVSGDISDFNGSKFTLKTGQDMGAPVPPTDTLKVTKFFFVKS